MRRLQASKRAKSALPGSPVLLVLGIGSAQNFPPRGSPLGVDALLRHLGDRGAEEVAGLRSEAGPVVAKACWHRWPVGQIDGKWNKTHLNQCHLFLTWLT